MKKTNLVQFMISVPQEIKDELRAMAARMNLENVNKVTSGAELAREIICKHFDKTINHKNEGDEERNND